MSLYQNIECPPWFKLWVADYCAAFGLADGFADVMLRRWWPAFLAANYTPQELQEALQIVMGRGPRWPNEHLPAVNLAVAEVRERRRESERPPLKCEGQPCYTCQWTGIVVVPHPGSLRNGEFVKPHLTAGVYCTRCGPGQRAYEAACEHMRNQKIPRPVPITIEQYEQRFTREWFNLLAEKEERDKLMRQAVDATGALQPLAATIRKTLGSIKGRAGAAS